jgi:hypothetical protein
MAALRSHAVASDRVLARVWQLSEPILRSELGCASASSLLECLRPTYGGQPPTSRVESWCGQSETSHGFSALALSGSCRRACRALHVLALSNECFVEEIAADGVRWSAACVVCLCFRLRRRHLNSPLPIRPRREIVWGESSNNRPASLSEPTWPSSSRPRSHLRDIRPIASWPSRGRLRLP